MTDTPPCQQPVSEGEIARLTKVIAKGGFITFTGLLLGKILVVSLHILLSRTLGAHEYGLYALGYSISLVVIRFSLLGLPMGTLRFVASHKGVNDLSRVKGTILSGLLIIAVLSIVCGVSLFFMSDILADCVFHKPGLSPVLKIFSLALPLHNLMVLSYFAMRATRRMVHYVFFKEILRPVLNIAIISMVFIFGYRLKGAVLAFSSSTVIAALLSLNWLRRLFPELASTISPKFEVRRLLRFSMPVLFIGFSYLLLNQISRIILGFFDSSDNVGIYNVAANICILVIMFLNGIDAIFAPIISDMFNKKKGEELDRLFKTGTRWVFSLSLPVALLYVIFSQEIMGVFGPEFALGYPVLIILTIAYLINSGTGSVAFLLQMSGNQDIELINSLVVAGGSILLNIILITRHGIIGAAVATAISIAAINLIRLLEVRILLGIQPYNRSFLKPLLAATGMTTIYVMLFGWGTPSCYICWPIQAIILMVCYLRVLFLLGLEKQDLLILDSIKTKLFDRKNKAQERM